MAFFVDHCYFLLAQKVTKKGFVREKTRRIVLLTLYIRFACSLISVSHPISSNVIITKETCRYLKLHLCSSDSFRSRFYCPRWFFYSLLIFVSLFTVVEHGCWAGHGWVFGVETAETNKARSAGNICCEARDWSYWSQNRVLRTQETPVLWSPKHFQNAKVTPATYPGKPV